VRFARKSDSDASRLCHMEHALMENCTGLMVDVSVSAAMRTAECKNRSSYSAQANVKPRSTVGEDRGYDVG